MWGVFMAARIRETLLFSALGIAVAAYATLLIADTIEHHSNRERLIQAEIAKVSRYQHAYSRVWEKLVQEHGSQEAALAALRNWAESMIDHREGEALWKSGQGTRPELREPLVHFTTSEAYLLHKANCEVPYGCSQSVDAMFGNWDAPDDDRSAGMRISE